MDGSKFGQVGDESFVVVTEVPDVLRDAIDCFAGVAG